jgi:hypothetical protein
VTRIRPAHLTKHTRLAAALAVAGVLLTFPLSASAFDFGWHGNGFLGLWWGVDPLDGSTVEVSITDIDHDGTLDINQRESFFTFCANISSDYSRGRGKVIGTAYVSSKTTLEVTTDTTCINDLGVPDMPNTTSDNMSTYTLESYGKILKIPASNDFPAILLHRIAR